METAYCAGDSVWRYEETAASIRENNKKKLITSSTLKSKRCEHKDENIS